MEQQMSLLNTTDERVIAMVQYIFKHVWVNARPDLLDTVDGRAQIERQFKPGFDIIKPFLTREFVHDFARNVNTHFPRFRHTENGVNDTITFILSHM